MKCRAQPCHNYRHPLKRGVGCLRLTQPTQDFVPKGFAGRKMWHSRNHLPWTPTLREDKATLRPTLPRQTFSVLSNRQGAATAHVRQTHHSFTCHWAQQACRKQAVGKQPADQGSKPLVPTGIIESLNNDGPSPAHDATRHLLDGWSIRDMRAINRHR